MTRYLPSRLQQRASSAVVVLALLVLGCSTGDNAAVPVGETPEHLSDWHLLVVDGKTLRPRDDALPYDLNTPLFTDYAHKLRTVWMPRGVSAVYNTGNVLELPVGTVLTKTFYYPGNKNGELDSVGSGHEFDKGRLDLSAVRLIETRVLVHRENGWEALPYVWNESQQDARLARAGDIQSLTLRVGDTDRKFPYVVPTSNECAGCHASNHTTGAIQPIGPKARNLNKSFQSYANGPAPQLETWSLHGYLTGLPTSGVPRAALWGDTSDSLAHRARTYLDVNCAHCHNPVGAADTSGLFLDIAEPAARHLGLCKPPIASGRGSGGRSVSIMPGHPEESILTFRIESEDPAVKMPEMGRSLVHREGARLIEAWIRSLDGHC
ncbi:MAG: hypothetical protein KDI19_05655 [Pseudomonadales bacterium]|nr:hypothetical protein [Pseudomonadales bacterium]